jgi:hypothetical protein
MSTPDAEIPPAERGQGGAGQDGMHEDCARASIRGDPMFMRLRGLMQEGQWRDAADMLTALESHYPHSDDIERLREYLALRLSAEEGWSDGPSDRLRMLRVPAIRGLVIANVLLYLLLSVLCLLTAR